MGSIGRYKSKENKPADWCLCFSKIFKCSFNKDIWFRNVLKFLYGLFPLRQTASNIFICSIFKLIFSYISFYTCYFLHKAMYLFKAIHSFLVLKIFSTFSNQFISNHSIIYFRFENIHDIQDVFSHFEVYI